MLGLHHLDPKSVTLLCSVKTWSSFVASVSFYKSFTTVIQPSPVCIFVKLNRLLQHWLRLVNRQSQMCHCYICGSIFLFAPPDLLQFGSQTLQAWIPLKDKSVATGWTQQKIHPSIHPSLLSLGLNLKPFAPPSCSHTHNTCEAFLPSSWHSRRRIPRNTQRDTCCPNKRQRREEEPGAVTELCVVLFWWTHSLCFSGPRALVFFSFLFILWCFFLNCNEIAPLITLGSPGSRAVRASFHKGYWHSQLEQMLSYMVKCTRIIREWELLGAFDRSC